MLENNPTIIVGHAGSGKTEFTVNYAIKLLEEGITPVIADIDIVNPYYRARELKDMLKEKGIRVISSNLDGEPNTDTPALAAALKTCFDPSDQFSLIDVGGDPAGSNILARYSRQLLNRNYKMWIAVNANRPKTSNVQETMAYIEGIEQASKLKINGIINTTHLLRDTSLEDILKGNELVKELSALTKLKVVYTVVYEEIIGQINERDLEGEVLPIKLYLRPQWL